MLIMVNAIFYQQNILKKIENPIPLKTFNIILKFFSFLPLTRKISLNSESLVLFEFFHKYLPNLSPNPRPLLFCLHSLSSLTLLAIICAKIENDKGAGDKLKQD